MNRRLYLILTLAMLVSLPAVMAVGQRPEGLAVPYGSGMQVLGADHLIELVAVPSEGSARSYGLQGACDRMVETQCNAACAGKGWGWPLECPAPESVPGNTLGPATLGLMWGYVNTDDFNHLVGAFEAGDYAKCYSYSSGEYRFGSGTPYMLWYITHVMPAATSYEQHADVEYFQALENGTYGPSNYDTAGLLAAMWAYRGSAPSTYSNIKTYDMNSLARAAYLMGTTDQFNLYVNHMYDCIEDLYNGNWWDVLGLACGIYGLAFAGVDFDPQAGAWADASNMYDMADMLINYQHPTGGFVWSTGFYSNWSLEAGYWYSNYGNAQNSWIEKEVTVTDVNVSFDVAYNIEDGYDYGYFEYSTDGGATWTALSTFTGVQDTYTTVTTAFPAAGTYLVRFRYQQDGGATGDAGALDPGFYVDNIVIDGVTDTCDAENGWTKGQADVAADECGVQDTAYCINALKAVDPDYYATQIAAAEAWLWDMQFENGGFETYPGSGSENSQVDGEAIWALTWEPSCYNDGDVNDDHTLTPGDAQLAFQIYLGSYDPNYHENCSADCNADDVVSPADALCIWKHYLGLACDCADPVIVPPSTKAAEFETNDGALKVVTFHKGNLLTVKINMVSSEIPLDAFGFQVNVPEDMTFAGITFNKDIEDWAFQGAQLNGDTLVVGAFDPALSIASDFSGNLLTMTFVSNSKSSSQGFEITNLVDDFAGFNIDYVDGSVLMK